MIEYQINLAGCECSVVEWNPDGKTVVLGLHGWLDNLATFEMLAQNLPDIRLIAFDFPGHGHSAHLADGEVYHFIEGLFLIDDLAEHFKLDSINLLGHSMGGAIATIYAAVRPMFVNKLLLIEALGPITSPFHAIADSLSEALLKRKSTKSKKKPIYSSFTQALKRRAEVSEIAPDLIKPLVERALTSVPGGYTWRADSRLRVPSGLRMTEEQVCELISKITADTLLIEGKSGLLRSPKYEHIDIRRGLLKNLESHLLPGGHHLHLEIPTEVGKIITSFINK